MSKNRACKPYVIQMMLWELRHRWSETSYGYLDKLQERALYTDTDSVVFIQPRDGAALVEIGDCLSAMASELKPNEIISEFVSGRPKTTRTKH